MGQLPEDAPFKAAHSSRNRARRMKAARAEARRLVGDALRQRDAALAELSSVKDQLTEAKRSHERECAEFKLRTAELTAKAEAAAENAASSHEAENLRRVNAETLESLESERRKTQSLMTRLGELNAQVEGERTEKEEFRQEILGLRSKMENASGLSKDEVNGLVAKAQAAEEQSIELSQNMATLQNQAEDYERQLNEAKDDYERLMRVCREELKKRKGELGEIYDLHEGELETNRELRKDNAALTDSIAKAKVELETVSAERDELQKRLADSLARVEELESSLDAEREGACRLRDSEQENTGRLNDLAQEKETLARSLAQTQKARADAVAALKAAQEKNDLVQADLQAAREESYRQRHDLEQKLGELERVNLKLAEESSRAEGAKAALLDADGVKSLALPCGLLPGEETTVALGSGFQKFRVQKIVYKSDGTIFLENERGQSVPMGTWR